MDPDDTKSWQKQISAANICGEILTLKASAVRHRDIRPSNNIIRILLSHIVYRVSSYTVILVPVRHRTNETFDKSVNVLIKRIYLQGQNALIPIWSCPDWFVLWFCDIISIFLVLIIKKEEKLTPTCIKTTYHESYLHQSTCQSHI